MALPLKGDQSYVLRVSIESARAVGPVNVRELLASNTTFDQMRNEILAEGGNATFRGHLRLGESTYWLTNVEVNSFEGNLTLSSDLGASKKLSHRQFYRDCGVHNSRYNQLRR